MVGLSIKQILTSSRGDPKGISNIPGFFLQRRSMRLRLTVVAVVVAMCAAFAGIAAAYDFSADMIMKQEGKTMNGKMFLSGTKSRMEMQGAVTISRMDKKVTWMLMPDQKMYMESQLKPGSVPVEKDSTQVDKVLAGKDTVDGKPATKYKVTFSETREKTTVYQWFLDANGLPVKTAALDGSWSQEFRNIKTGAQPANLFEVPAGYKKFSMPAMPGGMPPIAGRN